MADDQPAASGTATSGTVPAAARVARPSVVAVVVAHEPGAWFTETLESLAAQTYPRFGVVVVDAAGDPALAARVAAVLPSASVIDASDTTGFPAAADAVLDTELDPAFFLVCHDDVAFDPDTVEVLVTEALRSNAGVVGPKIVDWDHPERLQHVGLLVDRFAAAGDVVEPDELDHEQYDRVADVFAVPSVCMLVRGDLFREIEGFDPGMTFRGEDVDVCWRAQLAGARVIVAPDARVRHRERLNERRGIDDVRRLRARHQLRTVLVAAGGFTRLATLPLMAALTLGEALVAVLTGRPGQVRDVLAAWSWNLARWGEIRRRRRLVRSTRRVRPVDVQAAQVSGSVRLRAYVRGQIGGGSRVGDAGRGVLAGLTSGSTRLVTGAWSAVLVVVLAGTRALWRSGVPAVGDYAVFPDTGRLLDAWWSGWAGRDLGSPGSAPGVLLPAALLGWVTGGALGFVRTLLVVGPWIVALVGIWRVLAVTASRRGQAAGLAAAVVVPLPVAALSWGSSSGSVAFALSPWVLMSLMKGDGGEPFGRASRPSVPLRRLAPGLGVALGLAALVEPGALVVVPVVLLGLIVGAVLTGRLGGVGRMVVLVVLALPVLVVLVAPLVVDLVTRGPDLAPFVGGRDGSAGPLGLVDLARFRVGDTDPGPLVWALGIPAALALVVGRGWRFDMAVRLWSVYLVSVALVLADQAGELGFGLGDPAVVLAPGAVALAVATGLAVVAVEHDLRFSRFGWRQALVPLALGAAVVASLPLVVSLRDGRFGLPPADFSTSLALEGSDRTRVLWLGAPESLPVEGRPWRSGVAWAVTDGTRPGIDQRHPPVAGHGRHIVEPILDALVEGSLDDLGHRLGGLGVGVVVVVDRPAPAPFVSDARAQPPPGALVSALDGQLDLERLSAVNRALRVYRNTAVLPVRAAVAVGVFDGVTDLDGLADVADTPAVAVLTGPGSSLEGPVPEEALVWSPHEPDARWSMEVDGEPAVRRRVDDLGLLFQPAGGGDAVLTYRTPLAHRLGVVVQALALVALAGVAVRRIVGAR